MSYTYDAFGRVVEVGSGANTVTSATTTTYGSQGNVLSVTSPQGTVSYAYDNLDRRVKSMIGPASAPTSETDYTYDALGRLAAVTVVEQNGTALATPETTHYEYDLQGSLIEEDLPNGVVDRFTYNHMNRLTKETETGPGNAPITEYDYTYRADGLQMTETDDFWFTNNGQNVEVTNTISYTYDALDRLIDEAFVTNAEQILGLDPSLPAGVRQWETFNDQYFYDLDSNQVEKTTELNGDQTPDDTITSTYDANDRILQQVDTTSAGSTTTDYTYTDNGAGSQEAAETAYSGTPNALEQIQSSQQYQYDLQGRMTVASVTTYANGVASQLEQLTYGYDDNGNRVSALDQVDTNADGTWDTQTLTQYLNDANNSTGYTQVLRDTQTDPATGQIQKVTEYTIGLRQISQSTTVYTNGHAATPTTLYFGFDAHGSVRVLTNSAAAIARVAGALQLFNYDAYGNPIGFNLNAAATSLLYSGQQTDAATGLQYLRARYYAPNSGMFTTLDPYSGNQTSPLSYNKYLYTQANPVTGYDPTGMEFSLVGMLGGIAIGATLMGYDAYLAHKSPSEIVWAAVIGGAIGGLTGGFGPAIAAALAAAPPLTQLLMLTMMAFNILYMTYLGQQDAMNQNNNMLATYRLGVGYLSIIMLPLMAYPAQARIVSGRISGELAPASAAPAAELAEAWNSLPLLSNQYVAGDGALAGSLVAERIPLSASVPDGYYLYDVLPDGQVVLGSPVQKHSYYVAAGTRVRGAGTVYIRNGMANADGSSGHFMENNMYTPGTWDAYQVALRETFRRAGIQLMQFFTQWPGQMPPPAEGG